MESAKVESQDLRYTNTNLNNAYRNIPGRSDGITSTIYWLKQYLLENPTDTTIIELVKTLVDVEQKTSAAFDTLDTIMTSYAK